uniref:Uncharacterized protein n=1 Tax=Sinocyclocheilus rhinocerous TaxID=307959 RepID=A0A673KX82_9TELE
MVSKDNLLKRLCGSSFYPIVAGLENRYSGVAVKCFCDWFVEEVYSSALFLPHRYVCINGSRSARPVDGLQGYICPSGHSCPIGTPLELPCEPGTYSSAPGAAHCLSCPAATMCPFPGTQAPSPCPMGPSRRLPVCPALLASTAVHLEHHNHRVWYHPTLWFLFCDYII